MWFSWIKKKKTYLRKLTDLKDPQQYKPSHLVYTSKRDDAVDFKLSPDVHTLWYSCWRHTHTALEDIAWLTVSLTKTATFVTT